MSTNYLILYDSDFQDTYSGRFSYIAGKCSSLNADFVIREYLPDKGKNRSALFETADNLSDALAAMLDVNIRIASTVFSTQLYIRDGRIMRSVGYLDKRGEKREQIIELMRMVNGKERPLPEFALYITKAVKAAEKCANCWHCDNISTESKCYCEVERELVPEDYTCPDFKYREDMI